MKTRLPALILVALLPLSLNLAAVEAYRLDLTVYVFNRGDFQTVELAEGEATSGTYGTIMRAPVTLQFDDDALTLEGSAYSWSGGARAPDWITQMGVPAMIMTPGKPLSVMSASPVQYLEPQPDGSLQVRQIPGNSPDAPHCRFGFTIGPAAAGGRELPLACDLDIATLAARAKVPGVALEVGKPVLARFTRKLDLMVRADEWTALLLPAPNGSDYQMLLLVKAAPAPEGSAPTKPAPAAGAAARPPATGVWSAEDLDRFAVYYYQHPQPELIGRAIESLGASGFLQDRDMVFTGFFAQVFAAHPDRVAEWRKIADRQDRPVRALFRKVRTLAKPDGWITLGDHSIAGNDLLWGAFFASGNPAYLRSLAALMPYIDDDTLPLFWVGATAKWSLARNAAEHPLVRTTLGAYRPEANFRTGQLIDDVLTKDLEAIRSEIRATRQARRFTDARVAREGPLPPRQDGGHENPNRINTTEAYWGSFPKGNDRYVPPAGGTSPSWYTP